MRIAEIELRRRYVFAILAVVLAPASLALAMPEGNPAVMNFARLWYFFSCPISMVAVFYDAGVLMFDLGRRSAKRSELHMRARRMLYFAVALLAVMVGFILTSTVTGP